MMHWATRYIGVPYIIGGDKISGADCWGFVRLVLREQKGLRLPALAVGQDGNDDGLRAIFATWKPCDFRKMRPMDILTMKNALGRHVGIIADADDFGAVLLHCDEPASSIVRVSQLEMLGYKEFKAWRNYASR